MKWWLYYSEIETGAKKPRKTSGLKCTSVAPVGVCHNMCELNIQTVDCMLIQCDVSATIRYVHECVWEPV